MRRPELFSWPENIRAGVSLSFDDARASQVTVAAPVLDRHDVKATFYVSIDPMKEHVESWKQIAAAGHEIGNHTNKHVCSGNFPWNAELVLEEYSLDEMETDILDAQATLKDLLDVVPSTFAYPCGDTFVGTGGNRQSYVPLVAKHFLAARGFLDEHMNDPSGCDLAKLSGTEGDRLTFEEMLRLTEQAASEGS